MQKFVAILLVFIILFSGMGVVSEPATPTDLEPVKQTIQVAKHLSAASTP